MRHGVGSSSNQNSQSDEEVENNTILWFQSDSELANNQAQMADTLMSLPLLGLKLRKSSSFLDLIETRLFPEDGFNPNQKPTQSTRSKADHDLASQQATEKLKASNFPASLLRIGTWERVSVNEGDLVAKCYFAKRKLVWEFLEKGLKSKIEIQWADILTLRAVMEENEPGILEIELSQPPSFYHELDPQPRKHTQWRMTSDFTGGQAPIWRRHYLRFPPGALDRHYEKLLQCDPHLFQRSQIPFPSLHSPFFETNIYGISDFSLNLHGQQIPEINQINPGFQFSLPPIPISLIPHQPVQLYEQVHQPSLRMNDSPSPISVMDISCVDEYGSNPIFKKQRMQIWTNQQRNNFTNQVNPMSCYQTHHHHHHHHHHQPGYNEGIVRPNPMTQALTDIKQELFSDTQVPYMDENCYIAKVNSLENLVNLSRERVNPRSVTARVLNNYEQELIANQGSFVLNANLPPPHCAARQFSPSPLSAMPPQDARSVPLMPPQVPRPISMMPPQLSIHLTNNNTLIYPPAVSDGIIEGFQNADTINRANNWG